MRSLLLLLVAGLATPALAQEASSSTAGPATKQEKKICRMVETTGSILGGKRECHTKAEWAEMAERQRLQRENRANLGGTSSIGRSE